MITITMSILKVEFLKFGQKSFIPRKKRVGSFPTRGHLEEILNKISYPILGGPVDLIPWNSGWLSFHILDNFLPPWYPALKMTARLMTVLVLYWIELINDIVTDGTFERYWRCFWACRSINNIVFPSYFFRIMYILVFYLFFCELTCFSSFLNYISAHFLSSLHNYITFNTFFICFWYSTPY